MIIEISVAVIAVAFVVLVIYLITMIGALRTTMHQIDQTVIEVRKQMDEMGGQAKKTIEHTNLISFDLKRKMESLNSIFNTLSNVGEILESKTNALKKESLASLHKEHKFSELNASETEHESRTHDELNFADILELAGIGIRLWQKLRNKYSPGAKIKEKEINQ